MALLHKKGRGRWENDNFGRAKPDFRGESPSGHPAFIEDSSQYPELQNSFENKRISEGGQANRGTELIKMLSCSMGIRWEQVVSELYDSKWSDLSLFKCIPLPGPSSSMIENKAQTHWPSCTWYNHLDTICSCLGHVIFL